MHAKKILFAFAVIYSPSLFAEGSFQHSDPITSVILGLTTIFFFAIIGRYLARCFNQPAVLGELLMGILVGNLAYFSGSQLAIILREGSSIFDVVKDMLNGSTLAQAVSAVVVNPYYAQQMIQALSGSYGTEFIKIAYIVDILARFGVIFLLFMVGLESSVTELKRTGKESVVVAIIGVVAPMIFGFCMANWLMPNASLQTDLFVAAALSATSIGITARVLSEMNKLRTREAGIILGAAMLDDILGLIILAVVSSVVLNGTFDVLMLARIIFSSIAFFVAVLFFGPIFLMKATNWLSFLQVWESKLFISFLFIMTLSWLASFIQLAPIIGAFAAGIILHDSYFKSSDLFQEERSIQHLMSPIESILAPIFFMVVGIQVKLETFYSLNVIILSSGLIVAAILGKLISGFGGNSRDDRLLIGIGMLPRGEVGLVFASIGRTLGVISDDLFASIVLMVVVTTFIAPVALKWRFEKQEKV